MPDQRLKLLTLVMRSEPPVFEWSDPVLEMGSDGCERFYKSTASKKGLGHSWPGIEKEFDFAIFTNAIKSFHGDKGFVAMTSVQMFQTPYCQAQLLVVRFPGVQLLNFTCENLLNRLAMRKLCSLEGFDLSV